MSDDFMGGPSLPSIKFENVGDTAVGIVDAVEARDDVDLATNEIKRWPDGRPKKVYRFELRDPATGEVSALWVRGNMVSAIRDAVRSAGAGKPEGMLLKVRFDSLGTASQRGFSPPKLFKAKVEPAPANAAPRKVADESSFDQEEPF